MNDAHSRRIKTGGDPRTLADYAALRDELSKLTHPARPDVNWQYAGRLCLSLFEQNGVELQTAAWYTLARTQLAGLSGLNEGLAMLEALIVYQWGAFWPQPVHARMEILSGLSQRLQQHMRQLTLNYSDLSQLYRVEQRLTRLQEVLQRLELKHLSQLDALRTLLHNSAVRLENSDMATGAGAVILPAAIINSGGRVACDPAGCDAAGQSPADNPLRWIYVAQPETQPSTEVRATAAAPLRKWRYIATGMGIMLMISLATAVGWLYMMQRSDPLGTQLAASLAPLPGPLSPAQWDALLHSQATLPQDLIAQTQQQLARLDTLPPDWSIAYRLQLVAQAQALRPQQAGGLKQALQQRLQASALPAGNLQGWHQGMMTLKTLRDRLNGLDEKRGKYMTVSELKSVVFTAIHAFNQAIPAEEQLRVLSQTPAGAPLPVAAQTQLAMHLSQLIARYALLVQPGRGLAPEMAEK